MRRFVDNSGLLVAGTIAALVWANIDQAGYERFTHALYHGRPVLRYRRIPAG